MFFSASVNGFFAPDVHGDSIPSDAMPITDDEYRALLAGQRSGMKIVADEDGVPRLIDPWAGRRKEFFALKIAAHRYDREVSGTQWKGLRIDTAREARTALAELALAAMQDHSFCCCWKTSDGFIQVDQESSLSISKTVRSHVQACFDREAELLAHLEAGTFIESMLSEGWPA